MGENKDVEAQIKDVYQIQNQKSTTTAQDQTINQGFEDRVKNTDDETLDLNQASDRQGRNSSKAVPGTHGTLLQTIEPIEAKQIEFGRESPTKSTGKIEEKSNEGDDDVDPKSLKKVKDGAESLNADGTQKMDKSQGTQQSDERLNASQELLINKKGEEEPQDKSMKARVQRLKEQCKRLFEWGKANPLKVIIIVLGIIIFSLLVCIPIKDYQIRTYPEEIEMQQSILEGLRIRTADMEGWVVKNKSRYERIEKNAEYMLKELLNQTNGPEALKIRFTQLPDITKYHDKNNNYSLSPTLPDLLKDVDKTGGPLTPALKYKNSAKATVDLKVPDYFPSMSSDRGNILGVYNFRNVQLDSGSGSTTLFDMYVMLVDTQGLDTATRLERVDTFRKNEAKDTNVCCMNGGDLDLNKYMTGFGIIVEHYKGQYKQGSLTAWRKYCAWIYEGQFKGGYNRHTGFGRLGINNKAGELAVGYWSGFKRLNGKAVVHTGDLVYSGKWKSNEAFNAQPADLFEVTDLSTK